MKLGAIVLAGGESRRMGRPKALLPFGDETLLQRIVRIVSSVTSDQIIVAADGQSLPQLPASAEVVCDESPKQGPLEGLRVGLESGASRNVDAFFVTSCDVPWLNPEFIQAVARRLGDNDIAVPRDENHFHPLAAVYRQHVVETATRLLAADRRRPFFLFEELRTEVIPVDALRSADPKLLSLWNLNTPQDYEDALALLGKEN